MSSLRDIECCFLRRDPASRRDNEAARRKVTLNGTLPGPALFIPSPNSDLMVNFYVGICPWWGLINQVNAKLPENPVDVNRHGRGKTEALR